MRGPTGVTNPDESFHGMPRHHPRKTFLYLSLLLPHLKTSVVERGDAGAVIAAILKPPQSFEYDRSRLFPAYVPYNPAHTKLLIGPES